MIEDQNGECLICKQNPEILHVDHCHTTNIVRGLLCSNCNTGLGLFKDNVDNLLNAIEYLRKEYGNG